MTKLTPEQAIYMLRNDNRFCASINDAEQGDWTHLEITVEEAEQIAALLESLVRDAELGRAAVEAIKDGLIVQIGGNSLCYVNGKHNPIDGSCLYYEDCPMYNFCRLRAGEGK